MCAAHVFICYLTGIYRASLKWGNYFFFFEIQVRQLLFVKTSTRTCTVAVFRSTSVWDFNLRTVWLKALRHTWIHDTSLFCADSHYSPRSAGLQPSSATVFPSHIAPTPATRHQPGNSVFLSHHSSFSLPNAVIIQLVIEQTPGR